MSDQKLVIFKFDPSGMRWVRGFDDESIHLTQRLNQAKTFNTMDDANAYMDAIKVKFPKIRLGIEPLRS